MTELGGGNYRYLGLVLSKDKYQQITEYNFALHLNPEPILEFQDNPAQLQIAQINATHKDQLHLFREQ